MQQRTRVIAIIAAGGIGSRMGARTGQSRGKQLLEVAGKPLVSWAADAVGTIPSVDEVIVVCDPDRVEEYAAAITENVTALAPLSFVGGGATRAESVFAGLEAIVRLDRDDNPVVLIHDGARPLATSTLMETMVQAFCADPSADGMVVGHPCSDTIKHIENSRVVQTPPRAQYWVVQTPQLFLLDTLVHAYEYARTHTLEVTDDASLVEASGGQVVVFEGPRDNIKVTGPEDVAFVEAALKERI